MVDDRAFDATTFTKRRQRLLDHQVAATTNPNFRTLLEVRARFRKSRHRVLPRWKFARTRAAGLEPSGPPGYGSCTRSGDRGERDHVQDSRLVESMWRRTVVRTSLSCVSNQTDSRRSGLCRLWHSALHLSAPVHSGFSAVTSKSRSGPHVLHRPHSVDALIDHAGQSACCVVLKSHIRRLHSPMTRSVRASESGSDNNWVTSTSARFLPAS